MKVILSDVFIVPDDAPGLIAADMELQYMGNDTVQMRLTPTDLNTFAVNFSMKEMIEYLDMVRRLDLYGPFGEKS